MNMTEEKEEECLKRELWRKHEVMCFLALMKDLQIVRLMDGKKYRTADLFKMIQSRMTELGFTRTVVQIKSKWKRLKADYDATVAHLQKSGSGTTPEPISELQNAELPKPELCTYYEELQDILGYRPINKVQGIDSSMMNLQAVKKKETDGSSKEKTPSFIKKRKWMESQQQEKQDVSALNVIDIPGTSDLSQSQSPVKKKMASVTKISCQNDSTFKSNALQSLAESVIKRHDKSVEDLMKNDNEVTDKFVTQLSVIMEKNTQNLLAGLLALRQTTNN